MTKKKQPLKKSTAKKTSPTNEKDALHAQFNSELELFLNNINGRESGYYARASNKQGDTLHDIYCDFGYPENPDFSNFFNMYDRFGPATASVDLLVDLSWLSNPKIESDSEKFNKEIKALVKLTNLWNRSKGLDSRQGVGRYAGMLVEVRDSKKLNEPMEPLISMEAITNLRPIYEGQLRVEATEHNQNSDNFGNPTMYNYDSSGVGDSDNRDNVSANIHPTRLIISAEGADDGSIYGVSKIKNILNDLINLQKISGASGEGFYQNTRNAPVINTTEDYKEPEDEEAKQAVSDEIQSYLMKWQKKIMLKGYKFEFPNITLDNPKEHANNCWDNIAAGIGVSASEIRGAQTGVLAGDKDSKSTLRKAQSRRENFLTEMVRSIIDWFIRYHALENVEYEVEWDDLLAASTEEKQKIAKDMADTTLKLVNARVGAVYTIDEIRKAAGFEPLEKPIELMPPTNQKTLVDKDEDEDFINNLMANLGKKKQKITKKKKKIL